MSIFGKKQIFDSTKQYSGPNSFKIDGKTITCTHCGGAQFIQKQILLNTPGMTFFSLDWANKTASTLKCTKCSQMQWFYQEPIIIQ